MDKRQYGSDDTYGHIDRYNSGIRSASDIRDPFCRRRRSLPCTSGKFDIAGRSCIHSSSGRKQKELRLGEAHQLHCRIARRIRSNAVHVGLSVFKLPFIDIQYGTHASRKVVSVKTCTGYCNYIFGLTVVSVLKDAFELHILSTRVHIRLQSA